MANKPRNFYPGSIHHVYNRAVEKRTIFYTEKDYNYFYDKMEEYKEKTGVKIIISCVLPNHYHFLLQQPTSKVGISNFMSLLINSYTKYFNYHKEHIGPIFAGKFKSIYVKDDNYLHEVVEYIKNNPIKHGLVDRAEDWVWTSKVDYDGNIFK